MSINMKNFSFEHNGETLWYSRSLACACIVFGYDNNGDVHVLANKRGETEFNQHMWNVPGGFIDFDEDAKDCAIRETFEETGVVLTRQQTKFFNLDTSPRGNRQTMCARFIAFISDIPIEEIKTTTENCEPNEVEEIRWFPVSTNKDLEAMEKLSWTKGQLKYIRMAVDMLADMIK